MKNKTNTSNRRSNKSKSIAPLQHFNIFAALVFVLGFAVLNIYSGYTSLAAKPPSGSVTLTTPNLSLAPSNQRIPHGSTFSVQIWADSSTQTVNAVQANLAYPADKLNFISTDISSSAFAITAENTNSSGLIKIARGSTTPLSGKLLVATVNFNSLVSKSKATVSFTTGTSLLSSTTNTEILAATYGGNYSL